MGIIQKKSIHFSTVNFAGVLVGMLSTLFIYPLSREAYGLARFFIDFAWLMYPLVLFGMDSVSLKYFPKFKSDPVTSRSFLSFLLVNVLVISLVFVSVVWIFGDHLTHWLDDNLGMRFHEDPLIEQYLWILVPMVFFTGISMLFNRYFSSFHKITFPAILLNLIKVTTPILVLAYYLNWAGIWIIPYGVLLNFGLVFIICLIYLQVIGEFKFSLNFSGYGGKKYREIFSFSMYSLFASLGTLIAFRIDTVMVGALLNLDLTGEFGIAATIAQTIAIPTNAIITVAAPVISMAWAQQDMAQIQNIYRKASNNLLIPGLMIYSGMWACVDHLFAIMPNSETFQDAKWVVLLLGAAKVIDMATSVNNEIISYSKYYRFNFYAVAILAVSNVIFNLLFIKEFGIVGAALATVLSLFLYNMGKLIFIQVKFNMQPFNISTLKLIGIALMSYLVVFWWTTGSDLIDLLLKSILLGIVFVALSLYFKVSEDFSKIIYQLKEKYLKI